MLKYHKFYCGLYKRDPSVVQIVQQNKVFD